MMTTKGICSNIASYLAILGTPTKQKQSTEWVVRCGVEWCEAVRRWVGSGGVG